MAVGKELGMFIKLRIKKKENGKIKLVVKGEKNVAKVVELVERESDPIILDNMKMNFITRTFECHRCGEILGLTDNFCNGCGRPVIRREDKKC